MAPAYIDTAGVTAHQLDSHASARSVSDLLGPGRWPMFSMLRSIWCAAEQLHTRHFASLPEPGRIGICCALRACRGSSLSCATLKIASMLFVRPGERRQAGGRISTGTQAGVQWSAERIISR
ncbi:hypothetical protein XarjCFBP7653_10030 [Xanthomonas arboricola]|nr:hypothetical protein XarjCFBP7653_10030 [Xanthomonas arboricola]